MSAKFITGVLSIAATIAVFSAAPARASDTDDLANVVAGVATLYIAGKIINEIAETDRGSVVKVHGYHSGYKPRNGFPYRPHGHYGHKGKDRRAKAVPAHCIRQVNLHKKTYVLPRACLSRSNVKINRLPRGCEVYWRGDRAHRVGYGLRCLQRSGYRVASRW